MAVTFKTDKSYGQTLLPLFGVSTELCKKAELHGILIEQPSPGSFIIKSPAGAVFGNVTVKGQSLSLAKAGTLGPASKQAIQFQFEQALSKAIHATDEVPLEDLEGFNPGFATFTKPKVKPPLPKIPQGFKKPQPDVFLKDVPALKDATYLNQKVLGTSQGSVYRVAVLFKGCNMAVKISASQLSVRLEGPSLSAYAAGLEAVGIDIKSGYASCHYSIASHDSALQKKTMGAIIASIGFENMLEVELLSNLTGGA